MSFVPLNPRPMLQSLVDSDILVRLKWGQTEYKGRLVSVDSYMNIQLANTEEFVDGKNTGSLGQVLIRLTQNSQQDRSTPDEERFGKGIWANERFAEGATTSYGSPRRTQLV
ncbi:hypothetical protein H2199_001940 [Coniosporium tulheliwenetii]|uniref:Uncharacterized protein n=1 Tax=Coniosporium tulheliwenetii TaxID=3383036 RepID=A0ACC2ZKT1_9PEZI|nr:hypothetical protein H2199_001940 [Cladosporium sp. JES 115]